MNKSIATLVAAAFLVAASSTFAAEEAAAPAAPAAAPAAAAPAPKAEKKEAKKAKKSAKKAAKAEKAPEAKTEAAIPAPPKCKSTECNCSGTCVTMIGNSCQATCGK